MLWLLKCLQKAVVSNETPFSVDEQTEILLANQLRESDDPFQALLRIDGQLCLGNYCWVREIWTAFYFIKEPETLPEVLKKVLDGGEVHIRIVSNSPHSEYCHGAYQLYDILDGHARMKFDEQQRELCGWAWNQIDRDKEE